MGRSAADLKVKKYQDADYTVIGYKVGKGKYTGKPAALQCRLISSQTFYIGSGLSDQLRDNPPDIGSVITFKHYGFTQNNIPRLPLLIRMKPIE